MAAPCIVFALRRESQAFRKLYRPVRPAPEAPCWARWCGDARPVLLLESGIGVERVSTVLDWLESRERPSFALCAGFSGALSAACPVGSVVWATDVVDTAGTCWPTTYPAAPWTDMRCGRLLTMPRLVATAAEKRALGRKHDALAVDMESARFAERCTRAGIPFGCIRGISDDVDTGLSPQLATMLAGGTVAPFRFAAALARRPSLLPELLRLARDTRAASRCLGHALAQLVGSS